MIVNINDTVKVTLTKSGMKHLLSLPYHDHASRKVIKNSGVYETQLWCLMKEFGEMIHMGMLEVPFEGNKIEFIGVSD